METKGMKGAEAFLRVLASMGVERIFASPGSEWAPVWEFLAKPYDSPRDIPQYLSTRHEEVAVGMASGYAKTTGKLPAVMLHTTVGVQHATMAMRAAVHEQVPMVVFAGEPSRSARTATTSAINGCASCPTWAARRGSWKARRSGALASTHR